MQKLPHSASRATVISIHPFRVTYPTAVTGYAVGHKLHLTCTKHRPRHDRMRKAVTQKWAGFAGAPCLHQRSCLPDHGPESTPVQPPSTRLGFVGRPYSIPQPLVWAFFSLQNSVTTDDKIRSTADSYLEPDKRCVSRPPFDARVVRLSAASCDINPSRPVTAQALCPSSDSAYSRPGLEHKRF